MKNTMRLFLPLLLLVLLVAACGNAGENDLNNNGFDNQGDNFGEPLTGTEGLDDGVGEPLTGTNGLDDGAGEPLTDTEGLGAAGELEVSIDDMAYDPQDLTVNVGDTVTWTNNDDVAHTVTAGTPDAPSGEFDSRELQPGDTFSYTFDEAGTFDYFCTLHPDMTASVVVEEAQ